MDKITLFNWENRVRRTGFLQSKAICNEAEVIEINLTDNLSIKYNNIFWVQDYNLYDNDVTKDFYLKFKQAFIENPHWPIQILESLQLSSNKIDIFIKKLKNLQNHTQLFEEYVYLLKEVQKYYVLAVPLTNYLEKVLDQNIASKYAFPCKPLEMELIASSVNPVKDFPWIKTAYNIIEEVTEEDFFDYKKNNDEKFSLQSLSDEIKPLVEALQIAIYTRNRMKELSQKLWYYIEPLIQEMAKELNLDRESFLMLTPNEVLENKKVPNGEIRKRKQSFSVGKINNEEIIISGEESERLVESFKENDKVKDTLHGQIAYPGNIKGKVRIILSKDDFKDFNEGEILVTSMTTLDFIVLMQKASAIITDEGGLSCHAAIVSREMKKPCVIGTKHATQFLKTGDIVEIKGNKIIKK